jgi:hypothetical protein
MKHHFDRPNRKYRTEEDFRILNETKNYHDLKMIAMKILQKTPKPITQICGPITTWGKGSLEKNIEDFDKAILHFIAQGENVFDQLPFQDAMEKISKEVEWYDMRILDDFYFHIFASGMVEIYKFLPGRESSKGASWEHEQIAKFGHKIIYLPEDRHTSI